jgi:hypothetical protein
LTIIWWLKYDDRLPFYDPAYHLTEAFLYGRNLLSFSRGSINNFFCISSNWPPLTDSLIGIFLCIFNLDADGAVLLMDIIFLSILVFSMFKIGQFLLNYQAGTFAAFLVTMYPIMIGFTRHYNIDLPLMAMMSLSFFLLLKTQGFTDLKYCLFWGLSAGLGLLTKHMFIILMFLSGLYIICHVKGGRPFRNVFASLFVCTLIAGPWYLLNKGRQYEYIQKLQWPLWSSLFKQPISSLDFYLLEFINKQASFIYFLLFFISLILFVFKYRKLSYKILILTWVIMIYVIFTFPVFVYFTNERYTVPILIPVTLIISIAIFSIKKNFVRRMALVLVIIYAIFKFVGATLEVPFFPQKISVKFNSIELILFSQRNMFDLSFDTRPVNGSLDEERMQKIFNKIDMENLKDKNEGASYVLVLSMSPPFNCGVFRYFSALHKKTIQFDEIFYFKDKKTQYSNIIEVISDKKYKYFIDTEPREFLDEDPSNRGTKAKVYQHMNTSPERYIIIYEDDMINGVKALIYKHT